MKFSFADPWFLLLLLLLPLAAWLLGHTGRPVAVRFSSVDLLRAAARTPRIHPRKLLRAFELGAAALLILSLARPRVEKGQQFDESKGIDIVLVLDFSSSMDTPDFVIDGRKATRLAALHRVTGEFLKSRPNDRVGIVGFSAKAYLVSPLTLDHEFALETLAEARTSSGTAVGSAMLAAGRMLKQSDGVSKVQILVTDGLSNTGAPPLEAAKAVAAEGIRIYPVEILERRGAPGPVDQHPLNQIATTTKGQFFRATDLDSLRSIYTRIDALEKGHIREKRFRAYRELYPWCAAPALALLTAGFALRNSKGSPLP